MTVFKISLWSELTSVWLLEAMGSQPCQDVGATFILSYRLAGSKVIDEDCLLKPKDTSCEVTVFKKFKDY